MPVLSLLLADPLRSFAKLVFLLDTYNFARASVGGVMRRLSGVVLGLGGVIRGEWRDDFRMVIRGLGGKMRGLGDVVRLGGVMRRHVGVMRKLGAVMRVFGGVMMG